MHKPLFLLCVILGCVLRAADQPAHAPAPREVLLGGIKFTLAKILVEKSLKEGLAEYRAAANSRLMIVELIPVTPTAIDPPGPKFDVSGWIALDPTGKPLHGKITFDPGPGILNETIRSPQAETMADISIDASNLVTNWLRVRVCIPVDDRTELISITEKGKVLFRVKTKVAHP